MTVRMNLLRKGHRESYTIVKLFFMQNENKEILWIGKTVTKQSVIITHKIM